MSIQTSVLDGPMVYMVEAYRAGYDEFRVEGIFTKSDDADEFSAEIAKCDYVLAVAPVQLVPMRTVMDLLVADRIGAISNKLDKLIERSACEIGPCES